MKYPTTVAEVVAEAERKLDRYLAEEGHITIRRPMRTQIQHREMQASDLGLRCSCDRIDCTPCHKEWQRSFAPFAMWLGRDGVDA